MPEPPFAESDVDESGPWAPPWRASENPPLTPPRLNRAEREAALVFWREAGVLGPDGCPNERWRQTFAALLGCLDGGEGIGPGANTHLPGRQNFDRCRMGDRSTLSSQPSSSV